VNGDVAVANNSHNHHGGDHHHHHGHCHNNAFVFYDPFYWGWGYPYYGYGYGYDYGYSGYYDPYYEGGYGSGDYSLETDVQSALADRGYYHGEIDGVIGDGTRRAVRRFQRDAGLPVTGRIDSRTVRALRTG
jgi:hypothetical protein